jgi:hypothetical protein
MPPQWNPYEEIPEAPLPPLVAERGPLDDILVGVPMAPVQPTRPLQAIPDDLVSMVPSLPPPPVPVGAKPQPVDDGIPEPPRRTAKPQPVESLYEIPTPPKVAPADLAPDFTDVNLARALDVVEAPPSVDVTGSAQRAQTAERNLTTFTKALGDAQRETVEAAQRAQTLEQQAAGLDQQIAALKGAKKPTPEQKAELAALTKQRTTMDGEIKAAGTAVQDALGRFTSAREQQAIAGQDADQARLQAETDLATMEREAELRGAAAQEAGAALFAAESKQIEANAREQVAKIQADESAARARMDEDRKVYREALKTGPAKTSMVLTVASVIAEALAARHTGREPNFASVIGQLEQATKGEFDDRVQRQLALIAESEDSLSKAAQQKRVIDAQKAERRAEILATIEMDIQSKMAGARGTAREAQLAMVAGDVRKAKEAAEHQALIEQQKAAQANEKARLDRELQEAQIRKAQAEAAEKEAEAARKAGIGGEKKTEAWSARTPDRVYIPMLDTELASFEGQPNAEKRAKEAGAQVTSGFQYLKALNEYEAMLEDYGSRNLMDKSGWTESDEYRDLATHHAMLKTSLAKVIAGQGFSTTESDLRAAEGMTPLPKAWNDTSKAAVARMRKNGEDQLRITLSQSLDTKAQEKLIREVRRFGTSKRDLQRALVERAPEVLTDATRPVEARLGALKALGENIRKGVTSEGDQAERDAILAEINEIRNAKTAIAEQEYDPDDPIGGVTDEGNEVLRALKAREDELRAMWRKVGTSAIGVSERKQRDVKAGPGPKPSKIGGLL